MKLEDMTEPELKTLMNACGKALMAEAVKHGVGKPLFALLLFNDPKVAQYIGNCERKTMIEALREAADRLESREDVTR